MIELYINGFPPTVNDYYGKSKYGIYLQRKGRLYRDIVAAAIAEQMGGGFEPLDDRLDVSIILYPPDNRARDLDNYMKALLDACTVGGLWVDDKIIDCLVIERGDKVKSGAVIIRVNNSDLYPIKFPDRENKNT